MSKIQVIGHRGARGLVTENTLESIKKAIELGVDSVEFDVWTSKDGVPVVHHDESLFKMTGKTAGITQLTWDELKKTPLRDGKAIASAQQAIDLIGNTPFLFEIKDPKLTPEIQDLIDKLKGKDFSITSFEWRPLEELKRLRPNLKLYAATNWNPLHAIMFARRNRLSGITLKYYWLNPLIYWLSKHYGLNIVLFTVNNRYYIKLLKSLNVDIAIVTDFPDRAIKALR